MRKIASNDELMTTRQAGEALGVAVRTVQLWVESGVLPAWRTAGGHRRIARSAVQRLMAERAQVIAQPAAGRDAVSQEVRTLRLLVVEDDPNQMQLLTTMIKSWDIPLNMTTASNGFEGLLQIGQLRPDVLVTDLNMPGIDGFQMLRSLRKAGADFEDIAIIVVTAFDQDEIARNGGLPADVSVFEKPVPFPQLEALLREIQAQASRRAPAMA